MHVGCFAGQVTFNDNEAFVTTIDILVGVDPANIYSLAQPTSSLPYCSIIYHYIVQNDGSTWSGPAKLTPVGN